MAEPDAPKERDALNVSFADRAAVTPVAERNVLARSSSRSDVAELAERNVMEIERCVTVESPGSSATLSPNRSRPASFQRQRFQFVLDGVELPCEEEYESDDEEHVSTWVKLTFWTMFEPCGYTRIFWDLATILMVGYIAVVMPYRLAFKVDATPGDASFHVERFIDAAFIVDVAINFRTGFYDEDNRLVMRGDRAALHYLRTWFALDFVSSAPLDLLLGSAFSHLNAAKLLKLGKIMKVMKLLRLSKLQSKGSNLSDALDELFISKAAICLLTAVRMAFYCVFLCHLLACFMVLSGPGFLQNYPRDGEGDSASTWRVPARYLAAMYFAMTTMTTVGYGDIIPNSGWERFYAMIAMCIGGGFYGYVIGVISSLVAVSDANEQACAERMKTIRAWLAHHQFPGELHRRVRRFYKSRFEERTALDEQAILHELSDELREDVMQFLLPGPFRECYLFQRQNAEIVLRFADSIQPVASHAGEVVQTTGDTGDLMYVLASGTAAATRDFTGPGDSGLLAGADDAEKAPKKRHSLKRQQSQVSKSKKRMSAKLNGLDATFTPPTKRPTRPSMRRGRVERAMERSDCFGELVALAVHSVYHATLTSTSPAGFFATSQIQIYRNLSEFGGVLYDLRHLAVTKAVEDGFLDEVELATFDQAHDAKHAAPLESPRAQRKTPRGEPPSPAPPRDAAGADAVLAAVARLADDLAAVRSELAGVNAKLARLEESRE